MRILALAALIACAVSLAGCTEFTDWVDHILTPSPDATVTPTPE